MRKIVIGDPHHQSRRIMERAFASSFKVLTAVNGGEVLFLAHNERPDLIVLDVLIDGPDGYELIRDLKSDLATGEIPIIVVTTATRQDEMRRGIEAGAILYLSKPLAPNELLSAATRVIEGSLAI